MRYKLISLFLAAGLLCLPSAVLAKSWTNNVPPGNVINQGDFYVKGALTVVGSITLTKIVGANAEEIENDTDAEWTFRRNDAGALTIMLEDNAGAADATIDVAGAGTLTLGSADADLAVAGTGGSTGSADFDVAGYAQFAGVTEFDGNLVLQSADVVSNAASGTVNFGRAAAGSYTLTCTDDDANCAIILAPGGTGATTVGSGTSTAVTISADGTTDGDLVLPLTSVGAAEMVLDAIDFAQISDAMTMDAPTSITAAAGNYIAVLKTADDGVDEPALDINYTALDTLSATAVQYGVTLSNEASSEAADALLAVENLDAGDAVGTGVLFLDTIGAFTAHIGATGNAFILEADDSLSIGGGYAGGSGVTVSAAGAIQASAGGTFDGALDVDGATTVDAFAATGAAGELFEITRTLTNDTMETGVNIAVTGSDTGAAVTTQYGVEVSNVDSTEPLDVILRITQSDPDVAEVVPAGIAFGDAGGGFTQHIVSPGALNLQSTGAYVLSRPATGAVVVSSLDDDANADLEMYGGGTGNTYLGSATTAAVTIRADGTTDADLVLPLTSVGAGEVVLDSLDFAQLSDTMELDASTSITAGVGETLTYAKTATDGANEIGMLVEFTPNDLAATAVGQGVLKVAIKTAAAGAQSADAGVIIENEDAAITAGAAILIVHGASDWTSDIDAASNTFDHAADDAVNFGGGYGVTGCGVTAAGALSCNDAIVSDVSFGAPLFLNPTGNVEVRANAGAGNVTITAAANDAGFAVPTGSISATEIGNLNRSINLPLLSFANCTQTTDIDWASAADAAPDFALVGVEGGPVITYDDTGGSIDTDEICTGFFVPSNLAAGGSGSFSFAVVQDGATGANIESIDCRVSIDSAAIGAVDSQNLTNQTAQQSKLVTPAGVYSPGSAVHLRCRQGNASADDAVSIIAAQFTYTSDS